MTEKPPAFLLSCARDDALELGLPVFDRNIETVPPPMIKRTRDGIYSEDNAAAYLTYKGCRCSEGTLRRWRSFGIGPLYSCGPQGRPVWYAEVELDRFIEKCKRDNNLP
jgi:hypothetical protein